MDDSGPDSDGDNEVQMEGKTGLVLGLVLEMKAAQQKAAV